METDKYGGENAANNGTRGRASTRGEFRRDAEIDVPASLTRVRFIVFVPADFEKRRSANNRRRRRKNAMNNAVSVPRGTIWLTRFRRKLHQRNHSGEKSTRFSLPSFNT